jgi:hypothetical protein
MYRWRLTRDCSGLLKERKWLRVILSVTGLRKKERKSSPKLRGISGSKADVMSGPPK